MDSPEQGLSDSARRTGRKLAQQSILRGCVSSFAHPVHPRVPTYAPRSRSSTPGNHKTGCPTLATSLGIFKDLEQRITSIGDYLDEHN